MGEFPITIPDDTDTPDGSAPSEENAEMNGDFDPPDLPGLPDGLPEESPE